MFLRIRFSAVGLLLASTIASYTFATPLYQSVHTLEKNQTEHGQYETAPGDRSVLIHEEDANLSEEAKGKFSHGKLRGRWYDVTCSNGFAATCGSYGHSIVPGYSQWVCFGTKISRSVPDFLTRTVDDNGSQQYAFKSLLMADLLLGYPVCESQAILRQ